MCALVDLPQLDTQKATAILPNPKEYLIMPEGENFTTELNKAVAEALPKLRDEVENCPACIMAASRLKGIPVFAAEDFNYKDENASWFQDYNDNQRRIDEESTYYSL